MSESQDDCRSAFWKSQVPHKSTVHFLTHFHEKVNVGDHKFSARPAVLNDMTGKTSDILLCNLQKILNK
jgi:hypothetical protein